MMLLRALLLLSLFAGTLNAQKVSFHVRDVIGGLNCPWEIRWGPDDRIWFTERAGRINRVHPETGELKLLLSEPEVLQWHESGMLGFDFHPSFPDSPFVFVAYTHETPKPPKLELFRFRYTGDSLVDKTVVVRKISANFVHNGCRVIARGDKIFMSTGENDKKDSAQSISSPLGKILRFNLDGSIPTDNPFPASPVWSYGHRNPQGLSFGRNDVLYNSEHGTSHDDELNVVRAGRNYGWPFLEGFCKSDSELAICDRIDMQEPVHSWIPTYGVSGIEFYDHDLIPEFKNSILAATLRAEILNQIKLDGSGAVKLQHNVYIRPHSDTGMKLQRLRDICISPEGRVFLSTSNTWNATDTVDRIFEFVRTGVIPYNVRLDYPPHGGGVQRDSAVARWFATAGDSKYEVQLSKSLDFDTPESSRETEDTSITWNGLAANVSYYWRVRELSSLGPWSETRSFLSFSSDVRTEEAQGLPTIVHADGVKLLIASEEALTVAITMYDILGRPAADALLPVISEGSNTIHHRKQLTPGYYVARMVSKYGVHSTVFIVR